MDVITIYFCSCGVFMSFLICYRIFHFALRPAFHYLKCLLLQFLLLPVLHYSKHCVLLTRFHVLAIFLYLGFNVAVICVKYKSVEETTALMAIVNLIPTSLGKRINPLADFLSISIHSYSLIHRWSGRVAIIHAIIHAAIRTVNIFEQAQSTTKSQLISGCLASLPQI